MHLALELAEIINMNREAPVDNDKSQHLAEMVLSQIA